MAKPTPSTRIGEAERAAAQNALQQHLNAGRLPITEYADRSAHAANAVTASEIEALFADLPAPHPKLPGSPGGTGRYLAIIGGVVALALVATLAFVIGRGGQNPTPPGPVQTAVPTSAQVALPTTSTAPSTGTPGVTPTPLPDGTTVRRTTGADVITLRPSYGVDLDDDTSPNWNVGIGCCGRDVGLRSDASELYIDNDYAVETGTPDYATCSRETAYTRGPIERGSLQPGETICVRTNGRHYALITIVSASAQAVQFRTTVWVASTTPS
jgi:Domain of unknown function (DUF1707)